MRIGAVVQARMSSERLPGKPLMPLGMKPALQYLLERLDYAAGLDVVIVATSHDPSDDPLEDYCEQMGVDYHRGPLEDVAARMLEAAQDAGLDAFVRVNGDSPLLDQRLVDRGVELMRSSEVDLVTNVRPRSFPPGQSVEVVRTGALAEALAGEVSAEEREHVTGPLYAGGFRVERFEAKQPRTDVSYTLDTPEDAERLTRILRGMERSHWDYRWDELP